MSTLSIDPIQTSRTPTAGMTNAMLLGAATSGVLDAVNGVAYNYLANNLTPVQVLQYIASGLFGSRAFDMGMQGAAIGAGAHFFIAFVLAVIYVAATRIVPALNRAPVILGAMFGAAVFLVMNFFVLPLTNVVDMPITAAFLINGLIGHALLVGIPIALAARGARLE